MFENGVCDWILYHLVLCCLESVVYVCVCVREHARPKHFGLFKLETKRELVTLCFQKHGCASFPGGYTRGHLLIIKEMD